MTPTPQPTHKGARALPALKKMTCYFDNCICHQNCNCDMVLRDDARLVLVTAIYGQCMWAMQPLWSTATIKIRSQYKDPCHWLATL